MTNDTTTAANNDAVNEKSAIEITTLKVVYFADLFKSLEPNDLEGAYDHLSGIGYTWGDNSGTLVSVWDALRAYLAVNGCDHRVLKVLTEVDYVKISG